MTIIFLAKLYETMCTIDTTFKKMLDLSLIGNIFLISYSYSQESWTYSILWRLRNMWLNCVEMMTKIMSCVNFHMFREYNRYVGKIDSLDLKNNNFVWRDYILYSVLE